MAFEEYQQQKSAEDARPRLKVYGQASDGNGTGLALNTATVELLGRVDHVQLLFDRDEGMLGIRPTASAAGAFQLVTARGTRSRSWPWLVSDAQPFLRQYRVAACVAATRMLQGGLVGGRVSLVCPNCRGVMVYEKDPTRWKCGQCGRSWRTAAAAGRGLDRE